ncbi:hypothetical protein QVD17_10069 [Tagetes erecta]|uniref:Transmembrane protein n=1 Tax=Tagetes erecta TaxID=13708 RepID=A0AAD8L515_TARER|nr:hypothetical protein QVD17_10069 [Tagetes erecta]
MVKRSKPLRGSINERDVEVELQMSIKLVYAPFMISIPSIFVPNFVFSAAYSCIFSPLIHSSSYFTPLNSTYAP